jgi:8-oxo-dGTP pyrophosphatase MutT (NUDIX family)
MNAVTLVIPVNGSRKLLGMKARGFGAGYYNGYGGKPKEGELIEDAAVRETFEEVGLHFKKEDLQLRGVITFYFPHKPAWNQEAYMYTVEKWAGTPIETEEMNNHTWFDEFPYDKMWPADGVLFPVLMEHTGVRADVYFKEKGFDRVEFKAPFVKVVRSQDI